MALRIRKQHNKLKRKFISQKQMKINHGNERKLLIYIFVFFIFFLEF